MEDLLCVENYSKASGPILCEAAKYTFLLFTLVLAIRFWRRLPKVNAVNKRKNLLFACCCSVLVAGIGYLSVCHSLGSLYFYFGKKAFYAGNLTGAFTLFETSHQYWKSADALGGTGVCLLMQEDQIAGTARLEQAKAFRGGENNAFEQFYEGLQLFFHEQADRAVPLLEASSVESGFRWNVTRILSAISLERNNSAEAVRLMNPYSEVEVKDGDFTHAYVAASLHLLGKEKTKARAILDRFPPNTLSPFWKNRFEKLLEKAQEQTP
jgi:hypothetical protein